MNTLDVCPRSLLFVTCFLTGSLCAQMVSAQDAAAVFAAFEQAVVDTVSFSGNRPRGRASRVPTMTSPIRMYCSVPVYSCQLTGANLASAQPEA